jgi:hypothetical protein
MLKTANNVYVYGRFTLCSQGWVADTTASSLRGPNT